MYTFSTVLFDNPQSSFSSALDERVRLWIDDKLIIDQWSSISHSWPSGTFQLLAPDMLHQLAIDFKSYQQQRKFSMFWESDGSFVAAACEFSSPAPYPPDFYVDTCGWRLESSCDNDASFCTYPISKVVPSDLNFIPTASSRLQLGKSVASAGDLNGDGVGDILVGAPGDQNLPGRAYLVFLTQEGAVENGGISPSSFSIFSPTSAPGDTFGNAVCVLGDLDHNGQPDLAIAASGSIYIFFLQKGSATSVCSVCPPTVLSWDVLDVSAYTGSVALESLAAVPDLDRDGTPEIAAGNIWDSSGGSNCGAAFIFFLSTSGCSGPKVCLKSRTVKYADAVNGFSQNCGASAAQFGSSIAWIGDVNGDGVEDLAIGASGDDCGGVDNGAVWILFLNSESWDVTKSSKLCSGSGGFAASLLPATGSELGASVGAAGDLNGDGVPDLLVGCPKAVPTVLGSSPAWKGALFWVMLTRAGTALSVRAWGGASDLQVNQTLSQAMGSGVALLKDHNRDGVYPDAVVGCARESNYSGSVMIILSSSWVKWRVKGTGTQLTGPAKPLSGSSTPFAQGQVCDDGTRYALSAGARDSDQYSFLFQGVQPDCESVCLNDEDCNFFSTGSVGTTPSNHLAGALVVSFSRVLSGAISSSDSALVISAQDISASYLAINEFVQIDDEVVLVTNVSGSSVSVLRAQAGSAAAAHDKGAAFAVLHDSIAADVPADRAFTRVFVSPAGVASMTIVAGSLMQINSEMLLVTSVAGGSLIVQRAQAGTAVQFHPHGSSVSVVPGIAAIMDAGSSLVRYFPFPSAPFSTANYSCSAVGALLARVSSDDEFQTVGGVMAAQGFASVMLGITFATGWRYSDLSPIQYSSWAAGEPAVAACASMMSNGYWKGVPCSTPLPFICSKADAVSDVFISPAEQAALGLVPDGFVAAGSEVVLVVAAAGGIVTVARAQAGSSQLSPSLHAVGLQAIAPFSLASSLSTSDTAVFLSPKDTAAMGLYLNSHVKVESEVLLVSAFVSGALAVSRGQAGSPNSAHSAGSLAVCLRGVTSSDMDAAATTLYVSPGDAAAMSIAASTFVQIEGEVLLVSALVGGSLTVSRGAAGSTASPHPLGSAVTPLRKALAAATDAVSAAVYLSPVDIAAMAVGVGTYVQVDSEIMQVTAVAGGALTVTRAQSATAAAPHSLGAAVQSLAVSLLGNAAAVDATVSLAGPSAASLGIAAGVYLGIDSELLLVSAAAGAVATVSRGQAGTTAAAHSSGASVAVFSRVTVTSMSAVATAVYVSPADVASLAIRSGAFIQVESEVMLVTAVSGGAVTVVRAKAGTAAAAHASGSLVYLFLAGLAAPMADTVVTAAYMSPATLISLGVAAGTYVSVDSEVLLVTAVVAADGALTVSRAQAGSSAAPHSAGALVTPLPRHLAAPITAASATLALSPAFLAGFGVAAGKLIALASELVLVQSVAGGAVTVSRGQAGSAAASHAAGTAAYVVPRSALAAPCSAADAAVYVNPADMPGIPVVAGTYARIDDEILLVTAVSGPAISVSRGQAGSTAQAHVARASFFAVARFSLAAPAAASSASLSLSPNDALALSAAGPYVSVDGELMQIVSNSTGALGVVRGVGGLCATVRSCETRANATDRLLATRRKSSFLYVNASNTGSDASPGSASFVSMPGYFTSLSLWYHMFGDGMGALSVEVSSVFEPVCTGLVAAVASAVAFTLDASAPAAAGAWIGLYVTVGGETRVIAAYTAARQATLDSAFALAAVSPGAAYAVQRRVSRCFTPTDCRVAPGWTTAWSVAGPQQPSADSPWTQQVVPLQGYPLPLQVRIRALRGPNPRSNAAVDRILLRQLRAPASSRAAHLRLVPLQPVPSARLYAAYHLPGSPFAVAVRPGRLSSINTLCAGGCDALLASRSGEVQNLTITLVDEWGNPRAPVAALEAGVPASRPAPLFQSRHEDGLSAFVQSLSNPNERLQLAFNYTAAATYLASYSVGGLDETGTVATFAVSSLVVRIARAGGLRAVYYRGMGLEHPAVERVDATVDFSSASSPPGTAGQVPADFFSVRWRGQVRAMGTGAYTFMTVTGSSAGASGREGVRLRAAGLHVEDLTLLIDAWEGPRGSYTATVQLEGERLYDVELEYRDTWGPSRAALYWSSDGTGGAFLVVPSDRLYHHTQVAASGPVSITVV